MEIQLESSTYFVWSNTDVQFVVSLDAIWDFVSHQQRNCQISISYCTPALRRLCVQCNHSIHKVIYTTLSPISKLIFHDFHDQKLCKNR